MVIKRSEPLFVVVFLLAGLSYYLFGSQGTESLMKLIPLGAEDTQAVRLRSIHGSYIAGYSPSNFNLVQSTSDANHPDAQFKLQKLQNGKVAFQGASGNYLSIIQDGPGRFDSAMIPNLGAEQTFDVVTYTDGTVGLKSAIHEAFLVVSPYNGAHVNAYSNSTLETQPWQKLYIEKRP